MRLENVLALTHGKLLNEPVVNTFTNIVFDSKAVKRGDLFLAFNEDTIEDAIFNGAYGIVFCKPTQISDSEIAWIKVQDINEALKRLLRFRLIEKDINVYECNEIVLKLALQVVTETNFIALNGDIKDVFKQLWEIDEQCTILFCPTLTNKDIFTKTIELSENSFTNINIIEQTLFETSFIYDDIFYERQQISPFFIPYLEIVLNLFKNLKINYRLKKFTPIDHFEALFINKNFELKEFGTSDKVLIFEKNSSIVESEILFLQREATWAKIIYVMPSKEQRLIDKITTADSLVIYNNQNEIINLLKGSNFHFALIIGADKSILSQPLNNQAEVSLFDLYNA
jgi:ferrochelatase